MAVAVFGGTFDPFHKAHKNIVKTLVNQNLFSEIYVIPTGLVAHKVSDKISFSTYRLEMTRLALAKYPQVKILDWEMQQDCISYTVDTLAYLREQILDDRTPIYLVMGSDSLLQIESWHKPLVLMNEATLYVAKRPGQGPELSLDKHKTHLEERYGARVEFFDLKPMPISSTMIREQIKAGMTDEIAVPGKVKDFIVRNHLYRDTPLENFSHEQIQTLRSYERQLMRLMGTMRLIHSLNVMYEAVRLAKRFGVDPWKAALAGLLHDVAKEQDYHEYPEVLERLDKDTLANISIIHGPVGASFIQTMFGIKDPAIRDAIYYHSTLSPVPTQLEKVIYLADKIEPARDYQDLGPIREAALYDLDKAVLLTIEGTSRSLRSNRKNIHPDTLKARDYILKNKDRQAMPSDS